MKRTSSTSLLAVASAAVLLGLAGCGTSIPSKPAAILPPATGTSTLLVEAEVSGSASGSSAYVTEYTATVADAAGAPVSGATVRMITPEGQVLLMESPGSVGIYHFTGTGYTPGVYTLEVTSGDDSFSGARVQAPTAHTITSPRPNDRFTASSDLVVDWDRSEATQEVVVETLDYSTSLTADAGQVVIPAIGNPARGNQRVAVRRANHAAITGGRTGSSFGASFQRVVEPFVVEPVGSL